MKKLSQIEPIKTLSLNKKTEQDFYELWIKANSQLDLQKCRLRKKPTFAADLVRIIKAISEKGGIKNITRKNICANCKKFNFIHK